MLDDIKDIELQLSTLIKNDILVLAQEYSKSSVLNLNHVITLVQDINLLNIYDVKYIKDGESNEIIYLMQEELKKYTIPRAIALNCCFDYLLNTIEIDFKKYIYLNLSIKVNHRYFLEAFSFFNVLVSNVKELYEDFIKYIFNDTFLNLDEKIQIELIYKIWSFSLDLFHDNEASSYACKELKELFQKALCLEKVEVAFWLYYTPLHYFYLGITSNIDESSEEFKSEVEKPLEEFILKKIIPKYNFKKEYKSNNKDKKVKVAFIMQRIIRHSTINVFYYLVEEIMKSQNNNYEFVLYDLCFPESNGSDEKYVLEFQHLGIKYINLHQEIFHETEPTYSLLDKCIKSRERIIQDEVDILIGLHTRVEYIFFYATRTCAKQIYWYHGSNKRYDITGIDDRITHCGEVLNSSFKFKSFQIYNEYYIENDERLQYQIKAHEIKNQYPKNTIILGSIGRLIKLSEDYLEVICEILERNENTIYLACGSGDEKLIKYFIEKNSLINRFFLTGHINPKIYGEIIDIYLNTFPELGGESVNEFNSIGIEKQIINFDFNIDKKLAMKSYVDKASKLITWQSLPFKIENNFKKEIDTIYIGTLFNLENIKEEDFVLLVEVLNENQNVKFLINQYFLTEKISNKLKKFNILEKFVCIGNHHPKAYINYLDIYIFFDLLKFEFYEETYYLHWFENTAIMALLSEKDPCIKIVTDLENFLINDSKSYILSISDNTFQKRLELIPFIKEIFKEEIENLNLKEKSEIDEFFILIKKQTFKNILENEKLKNEIEIIKLSFRITELIGIPEYMKDSSKEDFFKHRFSLLLKSKKAREYIAKHFCIFMGHSYNNKTVNNDFINLLKD